MLGVAPLYPTRWPLSKACRLEFTMRHLGLSTLDGCLARVRGSIQVDQAHALRRVEFVGDGRSLTTHSPDRDEKLRALGLFGGADDPWLRFRSTWSYEKGGGRQGVQGTMTMHGRTHVVEFVAEPARVIPDVTGRRWYETSLAAKIDRRAWGVGINPLLEIGGVLLGHEVHLRLCLRAPVPGVRPRQ